MSKYYQFFGLERDPFLDTADPYFYCELGALRKAKERLSESIDSSRGLTIIIGDPGTGKTSLSGALEQELLADERVVLGKILDPAFATDVEFLIAIGRVFGLALPPRSSAALKNALKNFFFETAILEKRTLALVIDEAQNLSDENLETLRLLLNYHVPQRKLLNILLFGQTELADRIYARGNLEDRVDSWIRLEHLDDSMAAAILDFRLTRAGAAPGVQIFSADARTLLFEASAGLPRRMTMLGHLSMQEAADRASSLVLEDHVAAAMQARGIVRRPAPKREPKLEPKPEFKAEPKPEFKAEAKPEPQAAIKTEPGPQPRPQSKAAPNTEDPHSLEALAASLSAARSVSAEPDEDTRGGGFLSRFFARFASK